MTPRVPLLSFATAPFIPSAGFCLRPFRFARFPGTTLLHFYGSAFLRFCVPADPRSFRLGSSVWARSVPVVPFPFVPFPFVPFPFVPFPFVSFPFVSFPFVSFPVRVVPCSGRSLFASFPVRSVLRSLFCVPRSVPSFRVLRSPFRSLFFVLCSSFLILP
jgi:hypothetical protein